MNREHQPTLFEHGAVETVPELNQRIGVGIASGIDHRDRILALKKQKADRYDR